MALVERLRSGLGRACAWLRRGALRSLRFALAWLAWAAATTAPAATQASPPPGPARWESVGFYYGADIPWETLGAFDAVVVEPDHVDAAGWSWRLNPRTEVVAYLSVGEVQPSRDYFASMPAAWLAGDNPGWRSRIVDQSAAGWPEFFVERIVTPLWQRGFRSFFLDTLDSYQRIASNDDARRRQQDGLVAAIEALKRRYPQARLVFNRGFEILPRLHPNVVAVAFESWQQGWDAERSSLQAVSDADRAWLSAQLRPVRERWGLPVIAIDYVLPGQIEQARAFARGSMQAGFIPYVGTPALDGIGIGPFEVQPREVLVVHDAAPDWDKVKLHEAHRLGEMPFNYWGLFHRYVAIGDAAALERAARQPLVGRYAALLLWLSTEHMQAEPRLDALVRAARLQRLPILIMGDLPAQRQWLEWGLGSWDPMQFDPGPRTHWRWHWTRGGGPFEAAAALPLHWPGRHLPPPGSEVWLELHGHEQAAVPMVAITPWGGYAADEGVILRLPNQLGERWAIDPISFVRAALKLPDDWLAPDVTTVSGRRAALIHHDGDGFANRAEIPGTPLASEVMLEQFLRRYRLPTTVSFIEGEVSAQGLFAAMAPQLREIARAMAALPHVQIASHTYGHPFFWAALERGEPADRGYGVALKIPGWRFDVEREVVGSSRYIEREIAPPGKKVRLLLWSGDTNPLEAPIAAAYRAGLLNMNGGITWPTPTEQSLALVSAHGMAKGSWYQVYAPMQNENIYTNLWTGPHYGFDRLRSTFELTDAPYRLKPVNLYYHTYLFEKPAGIASAHRLYRWIEDEHAAGRLSMLHAADFAALVLDWRRSTAARSLETPQRLVVRSAGLLRQWRGPAQGPAPRLDPSAGVAGWSEHAGLRYLHLSTESALLSYRPVGSTDEPHLPRLLDANATLLGVDARDPGRLVYRFSTTMPLQARLAMPDGCSPVPAHAGRWWRQASVWEHQPAPGSVNQAHETTRTVDLVVGCSR
jgi:hypothetical protein